MILARSLVFGTAAALLLAAGASAADGAIPVVDPAIDYASDNYFEGFYAGLYAGGAVNLANNLHAGQDYLGDWHDNRFNMGVVGGYNFLLTESILAGVEVQVGHSFNLSRQNGAEAIALARIGYTLFDNYLIYAVGGAGYYLGTGVFAFGGGAEWYLGDGLGLRYEMLAMGELGENNLPDAVQGVDGVSATKFAFSAVWHLN